MLDKTDVENAGDSAAVWEKVIRKLRTRAMPPAGAPRPDNATYDSFATYLENELDRAAAAKPIPGSPALHRLNRAEYANAIRDLVALDIDSASLLPADDSGYGFDNVADVLSVSPTLLERYLLAAGKISRLAVGDAAVRPAFATYNVPALLMQEDRVSEDLPFGSRGGAAIHQQFPLDGEYVVKIKLQRNAFGYVRGLAEPHQLEVLLDGERIKLFTVGGEHKGSSGAVFSNSFALGSAEQESYERSLADAGLEVRFAAKAGPHVLGVAFLQETMEPEEVLRPPLKALDFSKYYKAGDPAVTSVAIGGPYDAKGAGDTPSRRRIFVCHPTRSEDEEACAEKILSTLARHAYRRPVADRDVEPLLGFYKQGKSKGGFEAGIEVALQRVLVSLEFLFRIEREPVKAAPGSISPVSDIELASRLSFFLWSSIPDDELIDLAARGKLKDRSVLEQQVRRMSADVRSKALVENFAGQWLYLRNIPSLSPDPDVAPTFDDNLRQAFQKETELFFESLLRDDRSALDLLNADYTFVNERLARHYGIPDVYGSHFRRVKLTDENRRGLLGQGSLLTVTSYANRTSPVLRGKWLLENILGAPPPPPPPNVPSLKEPEKDGKVLSMRQRMEEHRANAVCATCHSRMDPLGFALENFDATGGWRTKEGGTPIDASGVLVDGTKISGPAELRKALLSHPEQFVTTVTEKLLTYALGRGVEYYDEPVVRKIVRQAAANDYRWSSLILGVIESTPFQMRTAAEKTAMADRR